MHVTFDQSESSYAVRIYACIRTPRGEQIMAEVFSFAVAAGKRELVVKRESLPASQAAAIESGEDDSIYRVETLNHLELSGFTALVLHPKISRLGAMLQLILPHNGLRTLPAEIGSLDKLKLLDVSDNQITELPPSLYSLHSLQTLLLGYNALTDASFPDLTGDTPLPHLQHINLVHNQLTQLPTVVYAAHSIMELVASDNSITSLQSDIGKLVGLKQLELKRNKITVLPYELTACSKLRSVCLEENPLVDRRLLKLVVQQGTTKPRVVLEYITSHAPKPAKTTGKKGKRKKCLSQSTPQEEKEEEDSDQDVVEFSDVKPVVKVVRPSEYVEVRVTADARRVRPYLVCAVLRGVDLGKGEAFREFIALQTKLHDTVCKRRRAATIATHDLSRVTPPLHYICTSADMITLQPLGWRGTTTAQGLLQHIEANRLEKGGKRAKPQDPTAAPLSKYLGMVDQTAMVCVQDDTGTTISLPPLTNCELSKVDITSRDLLLEVTSGETLTVCKLVMDRLIVGMCEGGLVGSDGVLSVEQGKVVEEGGQLLVLYPSRTDLSADTINVHRP